MNTATIIFAPVRARRDWFRILRDLSAAGVSMAQVARKCNRDPRSVQGWADGGDPKDTDARIVLSLYARHCPLKYIEHKRKFDISCAEDEASGEMTAPATGKD
jgi:hypothetical protein